MPLGADDYDALRETIAVFGDVELLRAHAEHIAARGAGDSLDVEGLGRAVGATARPPPPG